MDFTIWRVKVRSHWAKRRDVSCFFFDIFSFHYRFCSMWMIFQVKIMRRMTWNFLLEKCKCSHQTLCDCGRTTKPHKYDVYLSKTRGRSSGNSDYCKVYPSCCMRRIRWSCEGLTSVHNEYTGWSLKHLLLRHMYNLSLPNLRATRRIWTNYAERVLLTVHLRWLLVTN